VIINMWCARCLFNEVVIINRLDDICLGLEVVSINRTFFIAWQL
jgi:hypothetical protein